MNLNIIFSIELEFYQKRSQPPILVTEIQSYKTETKKMSKNVSESILHGRIVPNLSRPNQ